MGNDRVTSLGLARTASMIYFLRSAFYYVLDEYLNLLVSSICVVLFTVKQNEESETEARW